MRIAGRARAARREIHSPSDEMSDDAGTSRTPSSVAMRAIWSPGDTPISPAMSAGTDTRIDSDPLRGAAVRIVMSVMCDSRW